MPLPFPSSHWGGFSPSALFAHGEQGVWYDPNDLSSMYQDSAGTTPVTGVEQPVGRILDRSGRGNHATQTTSAARPTLSARVNILSATATLSTQSVTTLAATYTLYFEGTGSITLSGTKTGTYSSGSNSLTGVTAGTLTLTVSGTVTNADLRVSNQGVNLPIYQRVTSSTDYDTAGFPLYLKFDGVDDCLFTSSINLSSVTNVTLFSSVRKLSDSAYGSLAEFGSNSTAASGFGLWAPGWNASGAYFGMSWAGTNNPNYGAYDTPASYASPVSAVFTGGIDISQATVAAQRTEFRINASNISGTAYNFGTPSGNFGNKPLYIGRRNNASLQLNGNIYGLIVRAASTSSTDISSTENWLRLRSRAY